MTKNARYSGLSVGGVADRQVRGADTETFSVPKSTRAFADEDLGAADYASDSYVWRQIQIGNNTSLCFWREASLDAPAATQKVFEAYVKRS